MQHPLLSVRDMTVDRNGKRVVHGVTLEADDGIVLLAGPNGAGKTSILRAIATVDTVSGGSVLLGGFDVSTLRGRRSARRLIGYLPQRPSFPGNFTAAECVTYSAWLGGVAAGQVDSYAQSALSDFDADHLSDRKLKQCSVGERQRIFLAQATAHRPRLLLLDEPTAAVDAEHRAVFRRLLRSWSENRLVVMATQLAEELEFLGERVVVIVSGRIAFDGPVDELEHRSSAETPIDDERPIETALRVLRTRGSLWPD